MVLVKRIINKYKIFSFFAVAGKPDTAGRSFV
jgi:hypothetical protein